LRGKRRVTKSYGGRNGGQGRTTDPAGISKKGGSEGEVRARQGNLRILKRGRKRRGEEPDCASEEMGRRPVVDRKGVNKNRREENRYSPFP